MVLACAYSPSPSSPQSHHLAQESTGVSQGGLPGMYHVPGHPPATRQLTNVTMAGIKDAYRMQAVPAKHRPSPPRPSATPEGNPYLPPGDIRQDPRLRDSHLTLYHGACTGQEVVSYSSRIRSASLLQRCGLLPKPIRRRLMVKYHGSPAMSVIVIPTLVIVGDCK